MIEFFQPAKQSLWLAVIGFLIRARMELVALTVGLTAWLWLRHLTGSGVAAWSVFGGVLLVVLVIPPSRRFAGARVWCVIDRHRLRTCLRQTKIRTMNMDGALPFLLWAHPTRTGERIWLWIRAGCCAEDLEAALSYIAPACYAREARLQRVRKTATMVAIDVIRRDPLGTSRPISSPLARITARLSGQQVTREGTEPIRSASVDDITTTTVTADGPVIPAQRGGNTPSSTSGKTTKSTRPAEPGPTAVVANGEDLSDYID